MGRLLALALAIGQSIYGKWLVQRLVSGVILIACLMIVTCVMISAILIGGFYAVYLALLYAGVNPVNALAIIGGITICFALLLIVLIVFHMNRLRSMPGRIIKEKIPAVTNAFSSVNEIVDAFLAGLNSHTDRAEPKP